MLFCLACRRGAGEGLESTTAARSRAGVAVESAGVEIERPSTTWLPSDIEPALDPGAGAVILYTVRIASL